MIYTRASVVIDKSQECCGVYLDINCITIDFTIRIASEVIVLMTTFNIFVHIRDLSIFFGIYALEIVQR
jgi:hypothetical protein